MTTPTLFDLTLPLDESLILYPGDRRPCLRRLASIENGDPLTASELRLGCHTGTHVDAPAHFLAGGATVSELPLEHFHGPAQVLEFTSCDAIIASQVAPGLVKPCRHLLLKTKNSALLSASEFREDYCHLTPEAAEALLQFQPLSIGFDYYSLDPPHNSAFPAHRLIAESGLPVFVCLDLRNAAPGEYDFQALPLNMPGLDGAPVRAVLFTRPPQEQVRWSDTLPAAS